jgi:hypothetical protein
MNVAFFWWYPIQCLVVIACALAISPRRNSAAPEWRTQDEARRTQLT